MGFCKLCGAPTVLNKTQKYFHEEVECASCQKHVCTPCSVEIQDSRVCKRCKDSFVYRPKQLVELVIPTFFS